MVMCYEMSSASACPTFCSSDSKAGNLKCKFQIGGGTKFSILRIQISWEIKPVYSSDSPV